MLLVAAPAHADRALLIGVGDYPALAAEYRLAAPAQDVAMLAAALAEAGFAPEAITRMTADTRVPTRDAVLAALADLARGATAGERVLVYFSGHGAQAPVAVSAREPDGLEELYLMHDAAGWDGGRRRVPGAITDREWMAAIDAIRARGADVWLVVDACHAAGVYRGADGGGVRTKAVPTAALGIEGRVALADADPVAAMPGAASPPPGRFAAFAAARAGALAIERLLPPGSADARPLSQFTHALTRAIRAGRLRSLRDLATAITATDAVLGGAAPEPSFDGALDMDVLRLAPDRPRRYPLTRAGATIPAGIEEGLAAGDRVRLVAPGSAATLGEAAVIEAALGASRLALPDGLPMGAIEAEIMLSPLADAEDRLLAMLAPLAGRGASHAIEVRARLWRPGARRDCARLPARGDPENAEPVTIEALPVLAQCDVLIVEIANRGADSIDVSPLYADADGTLTGLGFLDGGTTRLAPGAMRRVAIRARHEAVDGRRLATGVERLMLVALPARTAAPRDLRGAVGAAWRSAPPALDADAGMLAYRWRVSATPP
ncbi:caspase family protein [Sphingomonas baiyangensis]|nr:caspase family protein [Sphingomonas baiyangensis]